VNRAQLLRLVAAGFVFVAVCVLFGTYFFDPAVPSESVEVAVWAVLALGAGLLAASWWAMLLALPAAIAVAPHAGAEVVILAVPATAVGTAVLLGVGIAFGKHARELQWVGAALVGVCCVAVLYGSVRQVWPYNVTPDFAVPFDLDLGSAGEVHLDESIDDVRSVLGPPDAVEDGVFSRDGLTVWLDDDGVVVAVEAEDERFQTSDGVGAGDSPAYARQRWPGLVCDRDGFREPYCAGFAGLNLLLVEGNPIRSLTVSNDRCWPDLEGLWPSGADTCEEGISVLRPIKPQLG
jgi:hypothetical protein